MPRRFLDDVQAEQVIKVLQNPMIDRMLDEEIGMAGGDVDDAAPSAMGTVHKMADVSEKPAPAKASDTKPVQAQTPAEKPAPAPEVTDVPELTPAEQEIADLKAKLAALEGGAKPKRGRPRQNGARTPQVAPTNMDSAELKGPPLPEPVGPPLPKAAANDSLPGAGKDPALDALNATLNRAKELL